MKVLITSMTLLIFSVLLTSCGEDSVVESGKKASSGISSVSSVASSVPDSLSSEESSAEASSGAVSSKVTSSKAASSKVASSKIVSSKVASSKAASSKATNNMTLEQYLAEYQDELNSAVGGMEQAGMGISLSARGDSLVYTYKFTTDLGDTSLLKDSFNSTLDSLAPVFKSLLEMIQVEVPSAKSVTVEYLDMNGSIIASKEYK